MVAGIDPDSLGVGFVHRDVAAVDRAMLATIHRGDILAFHQGISPLDGGLRGSVDVNLFKSNIIGSRDDDPAVGNRH